MRRHEASVTWRAGAADVQRVIDLSHRVLDDVLGLADGALQQSELFLQQLLLQLLLLTRLDVEETPALLCWF